MINAGVHATPVGIVPADGHVIDADQGQKRRHCQNEPERAVAGDRKGQANHISLTGAPVAVQDSCRTRRIDVARPLGSTENHPFEEKSFESVCFDSFISKASQEVRNQNSEVRYMIFLTFWVYSTRLSSCNS